MRRDDFSAPGPHFALGAPTPGAGTPALSVVVPVLDEEATVPELVDRLTRVLDALGEPAEVILVDDGSRDGTLAAIARAHACDHRFKAVALSRNFGHQAAISAGLEHARGRAVAVMDGDLQDPPEALPELWRTLRQGFDVVYAVRASRPEGWPKRLAYRLFYRLLARVAALELPVDAGDFGIMSRRVVDHLVALPERRRFVRGLRAWVGFRQVGLAVDRGERHAGRPKYSASKLVALAIDGLVGFSDAPARLAAGAGAAALLAALVGLALAVAASAASAPPPGWAWVGLLVVFSAAGQLLFLAVLGEYVGRILHEVNGRPAYIVRSRIGLDDANRDRRPRRGRPESPARRRDASDRRPSGLT